MSDFPEGIEREKWQSYEDWLDSSTEETAQVQQGGVSYDIALIYLMEVYEITRDRDRMDIIFLPGQKCQKLDSID